MNKFLTVIGCSFLTIGTFLVIFLLYKSVNLTEGQSFIKYLPYWIASIGFMLGGTGILHNNGDLL